MELPNREKLEKRVAAILRKAFKQYRTADHNRQPPWQSIINQTTEPLDKLLDSIRLQAARNVIARFGNKQARSDWRPQQGGRAGELLRDLIAKSRERWFALKRPLDHDDVIQWRKRELGESRIKMIAITEVTRAHTEGEEAADMLLSTIGVRLEKIWIAQADACELCRQIHGTRERTWRRRAPAGPPLHPRCNCHLKHVDPRATMSKNDASQFGFSMEFGEEIEHEQFEDGQPA